MAPTVGEFILRRLTAWGVRRIYGYPGDGINGIMGAFNRVDGALRFIQVRHEESAALMACAHAKFTGEVGVCLATAGPGAIHLLNGLYDAKMDHQPVVAIVGQAPLSALGCDHQQEVDLVGLFKDVAHEYVQMASTPAQVRHLIDRAFRIAKAMRTVTALVIPHDVQEMDAVEEPPMEHGTVHSVCSYSAPRVVPTSDDVRRAADVLNAGHEVAMLIGAGAQGAADEVIQVADVLGAGVAKALLGKAVLPDALPFVTGSIGLLGTRPSWDLMQGCDTLLMVGTSFPYPEFLPKEGQARGVQIDLDARMLGVRYPTEVNLHGDSRETLRALIPMLERKTDRLWRERVERSVADWWQLLENRARVEAKPLNPQLVAWELSSRLPDLAILTADSGSVATWFARDLKIREGMLASLSGNLATMGSAVPYAIAAKMAFPDRVAFAFVGDGAMQMNGLNELITISKYWKEWKDPRLIVCVMNNGDLNMVTWEMRVLSGDPKLPASQDLPDFGYAAFADSLGLRGIRIERPDQVVPAWEQALAAECPVVIDAVVDPDVPPLPPHITFKQARSYWAAILKGDPNAGGIMRQAIKDMLA